MHVDLNDLISHTFLLHGFVIFLHYVLNGAVESIRVVWMSKSVSEGRMHVDLSDLALHIHGHKSNECSNLPSLASVPQRP